MGTDTKLIVHESMGSGMRIFLKRRYEDGHYGTLPHCHPNFKVIKKKKHYPSNITHIRIFNKKILIYLKIIKINN